MLCDKCGMQLSEKSIEFILRCLRLTQLRELCSKYELKVSGNKEDLLYRLQESISNLKDLLREFTVPVLQEICERCEWDEDGETYCLSTSGRKDELIDRISEHLEEQDKGITKVVEEPEVTEKLSSSEQKTTQQHTKIVDEKLIEEMRCNYSKIYCWHKKYGISIYKETFGKDFYCSEWAKDYLQLIEKLKSPDSASAE